jgi:hypothetical protein
MKRPLNRLRWSLTIAAAVLALNAWVIAHGIVPPPYPAF